MYRSTPYNYAASLDNTVVVPFVRLFYFLLERLTLKYRSQRRKREQELIKCLTYFLKFPYLK